MLIFFKKNKSIILIGLIFYFTILLTRLFYGLTRIDFWGDVARDNLLVRMFYEQGKILIGYGPKASVWNFYLPPFYYQLSYFLSIPTYWHPLTMTVFTIIIESATPVILFLWMRFIFKNWIALLISIFYSLLSIVFVSGTRAWNPHMIPFFTTMSGYLWFEYYFHNKKWPIIIGCLCSIIAFHLHYQSTVIFPFVLLMFILSMRRNFHDIGYWLIGLFCSFLTFYPYIYTEIGNHWKNSLEILNYFQNEHRFYYDRISKINYLITFLPGFLERAMIGKNISGLIIGRFTFFIGVISLCIYSLFDSRRRLLCVYFLLIFLMLRLYKGDKNDFYMAPLFVFPAISMGFLMEKFNKISFGLIVIILFYSGNYLLNNQPHNDLADLSNEMKVFNSLVPTGSHVRVIIHDENVINVLAYGIKNMSSLKIDPNAKILIDVCTDQISCLGLGKNVKIINSADKFSYLLKANNGYLLKTSKNYNNKIFFTVGTVKEPLLTTSKPFAYPKNYGTDKIDIESPDFIDSLSKTQ